MKDARWFPPVATNADLGRLDPPSTTLVVAERPRTPMTWAAFALAAMCEDLENGATPDAVFVEHFKERQLDLAEAVDRRIAMRRRIESELKLKRDMRAELDAEIQRLKELDEKCDADTVAVIKSNPDLPYKGELGRLALQANPPSVKFAFGEKAVTPDMCTFFAIPEEYLKRTIELKSSVIKDALKAGVKLPWAELDSSGQHLRVRKS